MKTVSPMQFDVFPAIDIYGGKCVRLFQGDYSAKTEYDANPVAVAKGFLEARPRWLHVVDLDAAKSGGSENHRIIAEIAALASRAGVGLQVGGGVRSKEAVEALLASGVSRCIIGTAVANVDWMAELVRDFSPDAIVAGLDGREGKLAVKGWREQTDLSLVELACRLEKAGVKTALVTDVARDGTLGGPNLELAQTIQNQSGMSALASGGIGSLEDITGAYQAGLGGVVVGRALYDGRVDLARTLQRLEEMAAC